MIVNEPALTRGWGHRNWQEVYPNEPAPDLLSICEQWEDINRKSTKRERERERKWASAAALPVAIDPVIRLNMVNLKTPYLTNLALNSMWWKFILDYKQYSQKCPEQFLWRMQRFILEEQLEVICNEEDTGKNCKNWTKRILF